MANLGYFISHTKCSDLNDLLHVTELKIKTCLSLTRQVDLEEGIKKALTACSCNSCQQYLKNYIAGNFSSDFVWKFGTSHKSWLAAQIEASPKIEISLLNDCSASEIFPCHKYLWRYNTNYLAYSALEDDHYLSDLAGQLILPYLPTDFTNTLENEETLLKLMGLIYSLLFIPGISLEKIIKPCPKERKDKLKRED